MPKSTSNPNTPVLEPSVILDAERINDQRIFFNESVTFDLEINRLDGSSSCTITEINNDVELTITRNDILDYFPDYSNSTLQLKSIIVQCRSES